MGVSEHRPTTLNQGGVDTNEEVRDKLTLTPELRAVRAYAVGSRGKTHGRAAPLRRLIWLLLLQFRYLSLPIWAFEDAELVPLVRRFICSSRARTSRRDPSIEHRRLHHAVSASTAEPESKVLAMNLCKLFNF